MQTGRQTDRQTDGYACDGWTDRQPDRQSMCAETTASGKSTVSIHLAGHLASPDCSKTA